MLLFFFLFKLLFGIFFFFKKNGRNDLSNVRFGKAAGNAIDLLGENNSSVAH